MQKRKNAQQPVIILRGIAICLKRKRTFVLRGKKMSKFMKASSPLCKLTVMKSITHSLSFIFITCPSPRLLQECQYTTCLLFQEGNRVLKFFSCSPISCYLYCIENVQTEWASGNEINHLFSLSPEPHLLVARILDCINDDYCHFCRCSPYNLKPSLATDDVKSEA